MAATQDLVNYYLELKGWDDMPKEFYIENNINYGRNCKVAKEIITLADGDFETAKRRVEEVKEWAERNGLEWVLETVVKRWLAVKAQFNEL